MNKKHGKEELDLWKNLINIRKDKLFDNENKDLKDQFALFKPLEDEAELHKNKSTIEDKVFVKGAYEFIVDFLAKYSYKMAIQYYQIAFDTYPTWEVFAKMWQLHTENGVPKNIRLTEALKAEEYLPENSSLQKSIAHKYKINNEAEKAEMYYNKAIQNAILLKDKFYYSSFLSKEIYDEVYFDYAKSQSLLSSFLDKLLDNKNVYNDLLENRINSGDFKKAKEYLYKYVDIAKRAKEYNGDYFISQLNAIEHCINNQVRLEKYNADHPFERQWNVNYKDGYQLYINFPTNSSIIPASDYFKLKELAKIISEGEPNIVLKYQDILIIVEWTR